MDAHIPESHEFLAGALCGGRAELNDFEVPPEILQGAMDYISIQDQNANHDAKGNPAMERMPRKYGRSIQRYGRALC